MEQEKCPNCNIAFEWDRVKDIDSGTILITTSITYCPQCLYIYHYEVDISK